MSAGRNTAAILQQQHEREREWQQLRQAVLAASPAAEGVLLQLLLLAQLSHLRMSQFVADRAPRTDGGSYHKAQEALTKRMGQYTKNECWRVCIPGNGSEWRG